MVDRWASSHFIAGRKHMSPTMPGIEIPATILHLYYTIIAGVISRFRQLMADSITLLKMSNNT